MDVANWTNEALVIYQSGLNYYDSQVISEMARRVGQVELWESAEMYQEYEDAYYQILGKMLEII
jgi:hypothetical protein